MRIVFAGLLLICVSLPGYAGQINVTVIGIEKQAGRIYAAACDEEKFLSKSFLTECPSIASAIVDGPTALLTLSDVPEGRFAVMTFQDLNGNGKLDFNVFGMPSEPGGFSGSGWLFFPTFDKAALNVASATMSIEVKLR